MEGYYDDVCREDWELLLVHYGKKLCSPGELCGPMFRDIYLLHYVIEGYGEFWNEARRYSLGPGDVFAIYPDELVAYQADAVKPWRFCWVGFRGSRAAECYSRLGLSRENLTLHGVSTDFQQVIGRCLDYTEKNLCFLSRLRLVGYLCEALACLEKPQSVESVPTTRRCIGEAILYMKEHLGQKLSVSEVAGSVGFEHSYFYRIFKKEIGQTPERFLMTLRIDRAKELIRLGYSFKETAALSGIGNVYYFSRLFRQIEGIPPSAFREKLSGGENEKSVTES